MTLTKVRKHNETRTPTEQSVDMKLEVVVIPVSDVDRAKRAPVGTDA